MKNIIKIVIISILISINIWNIYAQSNTWNLTQKIEIIGEKLIVIAEKKHLSLEQLEEIINLYVIKQSVSQKIKNTIKKAFIYAYNLQKKKIISIGIHQKIKNFLLYPYYQNTYLPSKTSQLLNRNIFRMQWQGKKVFLTFDDGPYKITTLDYFKKNNIPATFFLICNRITSTNIELYNNKLFSVWAHTLSHQDYGKMSKEELLQDIVQCKKIFKQNNLKLDKFRPAFWVISEDELDILENNNIKNYLWSIDSLDWDRWFTKEYAKKMADKTLWWDIILFHENVDINILDYYIKMLEKKGFSFWKL